MKRTATVIGAGPNGLAAAIVLAQAGLDVEVHEAAAEVGGAARSGALTLPGFVHDLGSAVYPLGISSPFFAKLPLKEHGLEWVQPPAALAHPLDDGTAVMLEREIGATAAQLQALDTFGRHVGLAFQIVDDILDQTATPEELGKATKKDAEKGKVTYPMLLGLNESRRQAKEQLSHALEALKPFEARANGLRALAEFVVERHK